MGGDWVRAQRAGPPLRNRDQAACREIAEEDLAEIPRGRILDASARAPSQMEPVTTANVATAIVMILRRRGPEVPFRACPFMSHPLPSRTGAARELPRRPRRRSPLDHPPSSLIDLAPLDT